MNYCPSLQTCLLAEYIIVYVENHKESTEKQLQRISEYSKVTGYKVNTEKLLCFDILGMTN